jgi:hypothetical protein
MKSFQEAWRIAKIIKGYPPEIGRAVEGGWAM